VPQIQVTFEIDANGITKVGAKDLGTGKQQTVKIVATGGLSEDQIQEMIKDAESHRSEDAQKKARADLINMAEGLVYAADKSLNEFGENLSEVDRELIKKRRSRPPPTASPKRCTPPLRAAEQGARAA
jgi:molecular chaperone DnaK